MKKDIAQLLLDYKAVKVSLENPFTWTSGISSPIYCDNRILVSPVEARNKVLDGFCDLIKEHNIEFDVLGGTATAAIPWAAFLAERLQKPMVYIRPEPKKHGAGKQVEGTMEKGSRVLIVEDLFSTGGSSIKSAEACAREYDAEIVGAMAIFTYGFPACESAFKGAKIKAYTLTDFPTLVSILDINDSQKAEVLRFAEDPKGWRV